MIKAVIFDLGGVLFTNGTLKFIDNLCQKYKLDYGFVKFIIDGPIGTEYREAKISRDEFWKKVLDKLNIHDDIDALENDWINGYELIEGTKEIVLELSKKYKVYYLSDNVRQRVERINDKYNFLEWFEGGIFSHEVGVRKPSPEIYKLALKKANVKAIEAVFIDDKDICLEPAKEMGMVTILFTNPEDLREKLSELKI